MFEENSLKSDIRILFSTIFIYLFDKFVRLANISENIFFSIKKENLVLILKEVKRLDLFVRKERGSQQLSEFT